MEIEKISLNTVCIYENREDLEKIRLFLEKKYSIKVYYTIFRSNFVLFVSAAIPLPKKTVDIKNYITDESIYKTIIQNKNIANSILNFEIPTVNEQPFFEDKTLEEIRLNLMKGFSYIETRTVGFSYEVMEIVFPDTPSIENPDDFYWTAVSSLKTDICMNLLEFLLFFFKKGNSIDGLIDLFLKVYKKQLSKKKHRLIDYFFNKDYSLEFGNIHIIPK